MYRVLNLRKPTQISVKVLSHRSINEYNANHDRYFSSFGSSSGLHNQNNAAGLLGHGPVLVPSASLSTVSKAYAILQKAKKWKKMKRKGNFTELLQVTPASTTETKTSVKNLKATQLHDFIVSQGVTVDAATPKNPESLRKSEYQKIPIQMIDKSELLEDETVVFVDDKVRKMELSPETLQEIIESYQTHKEEILPEDLEPAAFDYGDELALATPEIDTEMLLPEKVEKKKIKKKKEKVFQSKFYRSPEEELQHKAKSLSDSLYAYVQVCISTGMVNRALKMVLNWYHSQQKGEMKKTILNIKLYNVLLSGLAQKGNLQRVKEIMTCLREDNVKCTPETYAYALECLGRQELTPEILEELKSVLEQASGDGIDPNMIMNKTKFTYDKREIVQSAIQAVLPDFQPSYTPPHFYYNNVLLDHLNEQVIDVATKVPRDAKIDGSEVMEPKRGFTYDELMAFANEQLEIEMAGYVKIKNIAKDSDAVTPQVEEYRAKWDELNQMWREKLTEGIKRDFTSIKASMHSQNGRHMNLFPYLKTLDVAQFTEILMREVHRLSEGSESFSAPLVTLYHNLGKKIQTLYQVEQKKRNGVLNKMRDTYENYCEILADGQSSDNPRQLWQRIVHQSRHEGPSLDIVEKSWPQNVRLEVGKFFYNILMRDLKLDVNCLRKNVTTKNYLPAFYTIYRYHGYHLVQEIKPNPVLVKLLRGSMQDTLIMDANMVPMVSPPQPWSSQNHGGYLLMKSDFLRLQTQAVQQLQRMDETKEENLYPAIDSINQLQSVPWKVNEDILDVILEVFKNGGSDKLNVPPPPSTLAPPPDLDKSDATKEEKIQHFKDKMMFKRRQAEMYSLWCDALYRLSLANHFRKKVFWLPHNLDFRGRAYSIPPHLNHLGSDLARCLLVFHQKKPLGPDGFAWLKLHCINLTGLKKRDSVQERLLFAEEIMDEILDSADNPLNGRMWWTKSDEPWQTLSACQEIAKVLRSGDPENYLSSYPIHQDGSCNGLQHYAALGRDSIGAYSVNLAPCDVPQDVYSAVAALVEKMRAQEAATKPIAKVLEGFIRRKVVKQTVMTTVYGVTRFGARLQIAKRLKEIDDFPQEHVWEASNYLTTKTLESLREMFTSAKEIQDWFTDCAKHISTTKAENIEWVTPLGLPVVQPYTRSKKPTKDKQSMDIYEKPNTMKQKNAFPPNFIHSLDSSHMMLTSMHCERAGLTFISVHDCFWTHACNVPTMNKITREQFVALHSQPILEELSKFMIQKYSYNESEFAHNGSKEDIAKTKMNLSLKQVPKKGDFDLTNVLKSVYFFS
ncbi:DNA-directed RNA polymerase, mitochondrial isoform X2 [Culicoides brevitarsis]|uniref:DNA-directed RNA polymerase, mitochondrial isoform X2 n=1 Tax=Culicoides brevitarsis TaxID=469753 RepID=UPI00307BA418